MKSTRFFLLIVSLMTGATFADDAGPTTAVDKSAYTLFNPVPSDQLRDMQTNRPNKTNTPDTIDAGHLQIESGISDLTFFRHGSARNNLFSTGEENFRLGILNYLELPAAISLFNTVPIATGNPPVIDRHNGIGDLFLGGTLNLWGDDAGDTVWATSLAISPQFKIPTASHDVGNGHFEAALGLPFLVNLPAGFHLAAESILLDQRNTSNDGNVTAWQNMFSVDHNVFTKFDVYAEYWSQVTTEQHRKAMQTIDVGVTYAGTDSIMLDTGFNFGLNSATNDFQWLVGLSVRI